MPSPVIFIGMHRSGTSILGRIIEELGLFMGDRKDPNNEAVFFIDINNWILSQCGVRWDLPGGAGYLFRNGELLDSMEKLVRKHLDGIHSVRYLGWRNYLRTRGITRLPIPWGWKDPRSTLTLPLWLRIFPDAKIVYIERHGVDVANSLRTRSLSTFAKAGGRLGKRGYIGPGTTRGRLLVDSPRCLDLEGGFGLWKEYTDYANEFIRSAGGRNILVLKYEDFVKSPAGQMKNMAAFCGLDVSDEKIELLTGRIDKTRSEAFRNKKELVEFARRKREDLMKRGYSC